MGKPWAQMNDEQKERQLQAARDWKARRRTKKLEGVSCRGCGGPIGRKHRVYCSEACRLPRMNPCTGTCPVCGGPFETVRRSRYCSKKCSSFAGKLLLTYNMSMSDYWALLESQDYRCAICETSDPGSQGSWHTDHDHSCCSGSTSCGQCVRGLLCASCNWGLGSFRDSPAVLRVAADYIEHRR